MTNLVKYPTLELVLLIMLIMAAMIILGHISQQSEGLNTGLVQVNAPWSASYSQKLLQTRLHYPV